MKNPFSHFRHSLAMRLCLWILFFAVLIFVVSLGFLFIRSRNYVKEDAILRATKVLDNTALRVTVLLNEVEIATNYTDWLVRSHLQPDSIMGYSRRIIESNPNFFGCSIAFEPYYFPEQGEYFSAYSGYEDGYFATKQEGHAGYRYFDRIWFQQPIQQGKACWMTPFQSEQLDSVYASEMIVSYSKPIVESSGRFIGVVATDLSMKKLSQVLTDMRSSEGFECFILDKKGHCFVHSDTTKQPYRSVFENVDSTQNSALWTLGNDMVSGKEGIRQVCIDGELSYVFFCPLPQAGWSIAVVYPESEIFRGYTRLFYIVLFIIVVGLLLMLVLCTHIVNTAVVPINQLAKQTRRLAAGDFDDWMPRSKRIDAVGQLQNSFGVMQQSLAGYVNDIQQMNAEIEKRNEELIHANELAREAAEKKTAFMQDITHQVRTPLNIITGFAQVLGEGYELVSEEEMVMIVDAMRENSKNLTHIIGMLITASKLETEAYIEQTDDVGCNDICLQAIESIKLKNPGMVTLALETAVPDTLHLLTNRNFLYEILAELLENANRFTQQGKITIGCEQEDGDASVRFIVTDTGIGIAPEHHERIFAQFTKLDDFTEGIGLGLTLSQRIARILGGDLMVDAHYSGGARFVLTLPVTT